MTWIAYCPPGKRALAELVLLSAGEVVDEVHESRFADGIILVDPDFDIPLPPFDFGYERPHRLTWYATPGMINFRPGI